MKNNEQRLEYILDAIHCGTWEWNLVTNEVFLDERWAEIIGYTLVELSPISTQTTVEMSHPDDIAISSLRIQQHLEGKTDRYECETRIRHKKGHWIWVLDNGRVIEWDEHGKPLKMVGARLDISDRKLAEEALKQEGERFKALASASNTGVWEWNNDTKFLWCGPEYFIMLGRNPDDYLENSNLNDVWTNLLHPDDKERASQAFANYLAGDTKKMYENEFRLQHADGSWIWMISRGRTLRDQYGNPSNLTVGAHINITSLKEAQTSLIESQLQLEQRVAKRTEELSNTLKNLQRAQDELLQNEKLASLGALVAGVAHELNTPIGNALMVASSYDQAYKKIKQKIETGLTRSALDTFLHEIDEGNNIIERNLYRAAELIRSFKNLAVDQTSYQRRRFDLKTLSHEITITLHPTLRKTPFVLQDNFTDGIILDSYPGPLGQVLINLINNALIHAFGDSNQGSIILNSSVDNDWVRISIKDDGKGIPIDIQKKIFDPFFTTQLGQGGSGLGLHIVYTLVTGLLGGKIEVKSDLGKGTKFTLLLPLTAQK